MYWNVECCPVNVASIDCGAVLISQIPEAEHRALHGCISLVIIALALFHHEIDDWERLTRTNGSQLGRLSEGDHHLHKNIYIVCT